LQGGLQACTPGSKKPEREENDKKEGTCRRTTNACAGTGNKELAARRKEEQLKNVIAEPPQASRGEVKGENARGGAGLQKREPQKE